MKTVRQKVAGDDLAREMGVHRIRRRDSLRLRGYDYSRPGMYFITICTAGRAALFGDVMGGKMRLNDAARAVQSTWAELPAHDSGLEVDAFVVMPNHVHGILVLPGAGNNSGLVGAGSPRPAGGAGTAPLQATLGRMVAYFKYESAKRLNDLRGTPGARVWQRNYYEHVIRDGESLDSIRRYIFENPAYWESDPENPLAARSGPADPWAHP